MSAWNSQAQIRARALDSGRVMPWYEDIIDWFTNNPGGDYVDCAKALNRTPQYISMLMRSDFMKARLAARRAERRAVMDQTLADKAAGVASKGLDILMERFSENTDRIPTKLVVEATQNIFGMLGYTPSRVGEPAPQQNNTQVIVQVSPELLQAARQKVQSIEQQPLDLPSKVVEND